MIQPSPKMLVMEMNLMTATNKGFRTRAQLQMRAPRSVSYNITPGTGGVAGHYNGGKLGLTGLTDHARCEASWRADQNYHMDTNGWVDIAYTGAFCQHGICMAGRGFGVRTAANGTNVGNQNYYAFCWIGGAGDTPTTDALNAFEWWVNEARLAGKAGMRVVPHSGLFATSCPGDIVRARCAAIDNHSLTLSAVPSTPPIFTKPPLPGATQTVKNIQAAVHAGVDGFWGGGTDRAVNAIRSAALIGYTGNRFPYGIVYLQQCIGTKPDGIWGNNSKASLRSTVINLQRAVGTAADGGWGPFSEAAWRGLRARYYKY